MIESTLSIVVPVKNEENNIQPFLEKARSSLRGINYEIIFVDDGSEDNTLKTILQQVDSSVKVIELMKNYGQSCAMQAGIDYAQGEFIATIDGDLQNDPSDIPEMLSILIKENADLVAGERINRKDGTLIRKIPSQIANKIIRLTAQTKIRDFGCTLKVFRSNIAKNLNLYGELHRFIPILAELQGARIVQTPVKHFPRIHGKSKYGINRTFKVASDLLLMLFMKKYMIKPMHLFGGLGFIFFSTGSIINLYFLVKKIAGENIWGRPMLLLGVLLVLGGIQFITLGIMAELQTRTYYESQNKKIYNIRQVYKSNCIPENNIMDKV